MDRTLTLDLFLSPNWSVLFWGEKMTWKESM